MHALITLGSKGLCAQQTCTLIDVAIIRTTPNNINVCDDLMCELQKRQFKMTNVGGEPDDSILLKRV